MNIAAITREALAKLLIQEAESNGGALGVLVLMEECREILEALPWDVKYLIGYPGTKKEEDKNG